MSQVPEGDWQCEVCRHDEGGGQDEEEEVPPPHVDPAPFPVPLPVPPGPPSDAMDLEEPVLRAVPPPPPVWRPELSEGEQEELKALLVEACSGRHLPVDHMEELRAHLTRRVEGGKLRQDKLTARTVHEAAQTWLRHWDSTRHDDDEEEEREEREEGERGGQ